MPPEGYVPNAQTAVAIAEAVLVPVYGKEKIEQEKPLHAVLSHGVWTVTGTLAEGWRGGVAEVKISQRNGRILQLTHYR
jgi:hypothetical protein